MAQAPEREIKDSWLDEYMRYTRGQDSPEAFHRWSALTVVSAALRRHTWLPMMLGSKLFPNVYTILVAPSGVVRKSSATEIAVKLLQEADVGTKFIFDKTTPEALAVKLSETDVQIKNNSRNHKGADALIAAIATLIKDQKTTDKAIEEIRARKEGVHIEQQCNVFVYTPELSVFLNSQSYNNGLIDNMTRYYDCPSQYEARTKTTKSIELVNVSVAWLAASTADWLAKGLNTESSHGGFVSRILFIFQEKSDRAPIWWLEDDYENKRAKIELEQKDRLVRDLRSIAKLEGEFRITRETKELITPWLEKKRNNPTAGEPPGYAARYQGHLLKIAMLLSACRSNELLITNEDAIQAYEMLCDIEPKMRRALEFVGATTEAKIANEIFSYIKPKGKMTKELIYTIIGDKTRNIKEFEDIMQSLIEKGKISKGTNKRHQIVYSVVEEKGEKDEDEVVVVEEREMVRPTPLLSLIQKTVTDIKEETKHAKN